MKQPKYLSVSGLKNYLSCPYKYYKTQVERLRLIVPKAYFAFGKAIHKGIEKRIAEKLNPASVFQEAWQYEAIVDLQYGSRESHQTLLEQGVRMLQAWESNETTQELLEVPATAEISITSEVEGVPLYGIIDYLNDDFLVDWKTASSEYGEEKKLDLQLSFYSLLMERSGYNPDRSYGYGVIIKNKTPRVQYLFTTLTDKERREVKDLISIAWEGITAGKFHRIPNSTCSFCDYLPLCLGKEGAETLYASTLDIEEV